MNSLYVYQMASALVWELEEREGEGGKGRDKEREREKLPVFSGISRWEKFGGRRDNKGTIF